MGLEDELRKIEDLRKDLSVEIVIRKEEGHWEGETFEGWTEGKHQEYVRANATWEIDQPRIAEPDIQKREAARAQLKQIYDSSEWYSARYVSGMALSIKKEELEKNLIRWLKESESNLSATYSQEVYHGGDSYASPMSATGSFIVEEEGSYSYEDRPDETKRNHAKKDLRYMHKNLFSKEARKQAGKILGYSSLRIWLHELFRKK